MKKYKVLVEQTISITRQGWLHLEAEDEDMASDIAWELANQADFKEVVLEERYEEVIDGSLVEVD